MTTTASSPLPSPVLDSVVQAIERPSQASPSNNLRVLIVDDNHINLSILSTLLKRRFSHILTGAPVTVDSGLKAIQLLRSEVFDVCLLDIQMPYLDGVECARRIRSSADGVLPANADMHIVAVTTAVGDGPADVYRGAGMDGLIAKPVKQHDLLEYLYPLAFEALVAVRSDRVAPVTVSGQSVMPPMPPTPMGAPRAFYLPQASSQALRDRPEICDDSQFATRLNAQTRASLKIAGAMAKARSSTLSVRSSKNGQRSNSDTSTDHPGRPAVVRGPQQPHSRGDSVNINVAMLHCQLQTEIANSPADHCDGGDRGTMSDSDGAGTLRKHPARPRPHHRLSSPAWLRNDPDGANAEGSCITDDEADGRRSASSRMSARHWTRSFRDSLRPAAASATSSASSTGDRFDSDTAPSHGATTPPTSSVDMISSDSFISTVRRDSEMTSASGDSAVSDATSVETPGFLGGEAQDSIIVEGEASVATRWDGSSGQVDSCLPSAPTRIGVTMRSGLDDYFGLVRAVGTSRCKRAALTLSSAVDPSSNEDRLCSLLRVTSIEGSESSGDAASV